jgi:hypothetical protein
MALTILYVSSASDLAVRDKMHKNWVHGFRRELFENSSSKQVIRNRIWHSLTSLCTDSGADEVIVTKLLNKS